MRKIAYVSEGSTYFKTMFKVKKKKQRQNPYANNYLGKTTYFI